MNIDNIKPHNSRKNNDYENLRAGTVIYDKNDKLLLVLQKNNIWSLPKGSVKHNESFYNAALRETYEETGMDISLYTPIAIEEYLLYGNTSYYVFIYKLPIAYNELEFNNTYLNEVSDVKWVTINPSFLKDYRVNLLTRSYILNNNKIKRNYNTRKELSEVNSVKLYLYKMPIMKNIYNKTIRGGKIKNKVRKTYKNKNINI